MGLDAIVGGLDGILASSGSGGAAETAPYNYPTDISGLEAWWSPRRSDGYTASGGFVSQLNDLTGNGHTLVQATGAKQPAIGGANKIGLADALFFDGTDDVLTGTPFIHSLSAKTVFMVSKSAGFGLGADRDQTILAEGKSTVITPLLFPFSLGYSATNVLMLLNSQTRGDDNIIDYNANGDDIAYDGNVNVFSFVDNGTTAFNEIDGVLNKSYSYTKSTLTLNVLSLGCRKNSSETTFHLGLVGDILVYNRVLSASERARVVAMLQGWYAAPVKQNVHLLIIAGQSNAEGQGLLSEVAAAHAAMDTYYATLPSDVYCYRKVYEVNHDSGLQGDFRIASTYYKPDGQMYKFGKTYNKTTRTTHSQGGESRNSTLMGVELQYVYEHQLANPGVKIVVVKCGVAGSSMAAWDFGGAASNKNWAFMRDYMLRPAMDDMDKMGFVPSTVKVFWMQGEADGSAGYAGTTQASYQAYLDDLRKAFLAEVDVYGAPVKFVIGGLSTTYDSPTEGQAVKDAQIAWCAIPANSAVLVKTDGTDGNPAVTLQGDAVHYSCAGFCDPTNGFGKRVYNA